METQQPMLQGWAIAALVVLMPVMLFLFYKVFTAKTRIGHWAGFGLLMVLGTLLMVVLSKGGFFPSQDMIAQQAVRPPPTPGEALSMLPTPLLVSLGLAALIWLGGGNWIIIRQRRKAGRSWGESLNPFNPPFRDMNAKAWMQMALLAVLTFAVVGVGLQLTEAQRAAQQASPTLESQD